MAGLWDDATAPFTGQPPQDSSSLWGWLSSLFQRGQPSGSGNQPQPQPPVPTYTGPGVDPSLYPGAANWSAGAPASLLYAPPSLYTAANPQQQALWNQASTPQGWAALAAAPSAPPVAGGGGGGLLRVPPLPERKPQVPPPDGGWQGWAGVQGLPGGPSGVNPRVVFANPNNPMPMGGAFGYAGSPGAEGGPSGPAAPRAQPGRNISDEEIARLNPSDIRRVLSRSDLTAADNAALEARLNAMLRGM